MSIFTWNLIAYLLIFTAVGEIILRNRHIIGGIYAPLRCLAALTAGLWIFALKVAPSGPPPVRIASFVLALLVSLILTEVLAVTLYNFVMIFPILTREELPWWVKKYGPTYKGVFFVPTLVRVRQGPVGKFIEFLGKIHLVKLHNPSAENTAEGAKTKETAGISGSQKIHTAGGKNER